MTTQYRRWGKRLFDLTVSAILLILFAPVFLVVAIVVRMRIGAPVLFRQQRPGLLGRPFTLLKFRTMTDARDGEGRLLPDDQRLTPAGSALRRLSLDELPEFWNVVRGNMSLVGPRPLLMQYLPRYTAQQARRHGVRPGITGLAQAEGRNALSWEDKFRLDVAYVDTVSFGLDLRILLRTARTVLAGRGISAAGCATMTEFMGQEPGTSGTAPREAVPPAALRNEDS
jgi:lipopolysaccharide/colanic/teichoic acid biosynthesis glycosyltransferase